MRFLFPAFLLGALAAAVPIALHLLRRDRAPEVPFTALRLLRPQRLPRSRRRRLRDLLLLGTRVAGLLLLAAAFARPYLAGSTGDAPVAIVAVDTSYSMGAPERFARALAVAREEIDRVPSDRPIAVVAFDDGAEVVAEPGSAGAARGALDALTVGSGGTAYGPVFARAREIGGAAGATLTIIGDLQRRGSDGAGLGSLPASIDVRIRDVGPPPPNAAVASVRIVDGGIAATIDSSHAGAFTTSARLRVDGRVVSEALVTVAAATPLHVTFRRDVPAGAAVAVEIDDRDGLPADDVRYLVAHGQARVLVLGAGAEPIYVARALDAADIPYQVVQDEPLTAGSRVSDHELMDASAVVLLSTRGLDRVVRAGVEQFVRDGGGLLVSASSQTDGAVLSAMLNWPDFSAVPRAAAPARLAVTDLRHPIFGAFGGLAANLGAVRFARVWAIQRHPSPAAGRGHRGDAASREEGSRSGATERTEGVAGNAEQVGWHVIARFTDGSPALVERPHGAGRVLLFASDLDLDWNDFPLHAAFVPFVAEAIRHVGGPAAARADYVVARTPAGIPAQPGVYALDGTGRRVAVNVDPGESSPARFTSEEFLAMLPATRTGAADSAIALPAADVESRQSYWRYGILLLIATLVAESFIGRVS